MFNLFFAPVEAPQRLPEVQVFVATYAEQKIPWPWLQSEYTNGILFIVWCQAHTVKAQILYFWLLTVMRREAWRLVNQTRREQQRLVVPLVESVSTGKFEEELLIELSIKALPSSYQQVLYLVVAGFTVREIADKLQVSVGTCHQRLCRARALLRRALA